MTNPEILIREASHLAPTIQDCRGEIDSSRQLPERLVDALRSAGMFRLFAPAKFGGCEIDPITFVKIIEQLSCVDASVGWVVSVCSVGGLFAGYMPEESACQIHAENPDFHVAGSLNANGTAEAVEGGYRVTGRWTYGSGIHHARWLYANCTLGDQTRMMLFPVSASTIHDTWRVAGLRGTGSHDFSVSDLFVPEAHSLSAFTGRPSQPGILYKYPFTLFPVLIAAVPLGIARGAIDAFVELAKSKKQVGAVSLLSLRASAQIAAARAESLLRSGRAFLFEALSDMHNEIEAHGEAGMQTRAVLRLACTQAAQNAAQAVDLMFEAGGISSLFESSPLERSFRDVHAAVQHIAVAPSSMELAGRVFMGFDPGITRF
jgi:alkylation response protein AidB-like acyl-CoA dehydrogenase